MIDMWREAGFVGLGGDELKAAASVMGVPLKGTESNTQVVDALRAAVGMSPLVTRPLAQVRKENRCTALPNLIGVPWGGRKYDVIIQATKEDQITNKNARAQIGWEGIPIYVQYGVTASIGEPWYHALNNAKGYLYSFKYVNSGDGVAQKIESTTEYHQHPFQFLGVTPGTENLPGSLLEWYQWEAERKDYFAKFSERLLREIFGQLYMMGPETWYKRTNGVAVSRKDIRYGVLEFLGKSYAAKMQFDDESYEEPAPMVMVPAASIAVPTGPGFG